MSEILLQRLLSEKEEQTLFPREGFASLRAPGGEVRSRPASQELPLRRHLWLCLSLPPRLLYLWG